MDKETSNLIRRLAELASLCFYRQIPVFSDFMTPAEQDIFLTQNYKGVSAFLCGGSADAERKAAVFLPEVTYEDAQEAFRQHFPCLRISADAPRFASDLTHRDFLGAVLGTGVQRSRIGDIWVGEKQCFLAADPGIAQFLEKELISVGRDRVTAEIVPYPADFGIRTYEEITGSIASVRLDAVLALACRLSRGKAAELLKTERVAVGGKTETSASYEPAEGQVISVRGIGKFRIKEFGGESKKGRLFVTLQKYVD